MGGGTLSRSGGSSSHDLERRAWIVRGPGDPSCRDVCWPSSPAYCSSSPAWAAAIQVTTTGDENGSNPGACSLREAVQSANLNLPVGGCTAGEASATDRITFATSTNGSAILLSAGTLSTTSELEIVGNGPGQTIVDGGGATQPFLVSVGAATLIQDLAIVNGRSINGGAIANGGSLAVVNTAISGGSATLGGAILNSGGVLSVVQQHAQRQLGHQRRRDLQRRRRDGQLTSSSTLSGNTATIGGGIYNDAGGAVTVTASTLSGNTGSSSAGGIFNFSNGSVTLRATLLDTGASGANCAGTIGTFGSNLADDSTCFTAAGTDQVVANVRIKPLADNGGPTRTHALSLNSPAVEAVQGACTSDGTETGTPISPPTSAAPSGRASGAGAARPAATSARTSCSRPASCSSRSAPTWSARKARRPSSPSCGPAATPGRPAPPSP